MWYKGVDQFNTWGGLWHIKDCNYTAFSILEDEIRRYLKVTALKSLNKETKKTILEAIMKNMDLMFQWTLLTANADDSIGMKVFHQISELDLTVHGFAFASSCLELYKQCSKTPIQKSKSLRKKVTTMKDHCD